MPGPDEAKEPPEGTKGSEPETPPGDTERAPETDAGAPGGEPPAREIDTLGLAPFSETTTIEEKQENTRGMIAAGLVVLLLLIIIASFASLWWTSLKLADVKGLLEVILAPVVALVGSATGFYFGGKK